MADPEDTGSLQIQKVECFERYSSEAQWVSFGEGTVLWQAGDGELQQRLLVMQEENGEWIRELEALDFPDPTALISCQSEERIITWKRAGHARECAMAFTSADGCLQVWEDVQALQEITMQDAQDGWFGDGLTADDFLGRLYGSEAGATLPEPTEEALPELVMRYQTWIEPTSPGPHVALMLTSPGRHLALLLASPGPDVTLMLASPGPHVILVGEAFALAVLRCWCYF